MSIRAVSIAPVSQVPIADIVIGQRRRAKLGRLQRLATSIAEHGLVHPILLRGRTLVAGHRRLEACRSLKWKTIPARQADQLSDDELRAIELDENAHREALSDYETSKARLAEIRQAEADLKAEARELRSDGERNSGRKRGRPPQPDSKRSVAKATGIPIATQAKIEHHVELAERYPFMQRGGWVQHRVLEAGTLLDRLPERDRSTAAALLDQDGIPPKQAIGMLENLATMASADRANVFRLARSSDSHERTTALTAAAALPPPVDPALLQLTAAEEQLRRAAKICRTPDFQPKVRALAARTTELLTEFQEANNDARRSIAEHEPVRNASATP